MAQVSVKDVMAIVRSVEHFKGKHIKGLLTDLEALGVLTPEVRKLVLDHFNGFSRAILTRLGYSPE